MTADGHIVEGVLSGGEVHDIKLAPELMQDVYGVRVLADRGYDSQAFREFLRGQNCTPVIPSRGNRKEEIVYDKELYKQRGLIERIFGKIKENGRLAVRKEKSDRHFLSMIALACVRMIIKLIS